MNEDLIKPEIHALIERRDWAGLRTAVIDLPPAETSDLLLDLETPDRAVLRGAPARPCRRGVRAPAARAAGHVAP